jgi:hypothetical protein
MKQYLLSVCYPAGSTAPSPRQLENIMRDVAALRREMQGAGVWVFSGGLESSNTASVLRHKSSQVIITDGPFIESKEMIGGITILRVPDHDEALMWARRLSEATTTPIEVRPFLEQFP